MSIELGILNVVNSLLPPQEIGFIRIMTHRAVLVTPLSVDRAIAHIRSWHTRPDVSVLEPGPRHLELLDRMFRSLGAAGRLTTDAHLAALAI